MQLVTQHVPFTLIHTPCCGSILCYVNSRMPNFCSECGARLYAMKKNPECIWLRDDNAQLKYREP